MTTVNIYLNFKGNCEIAFNFYRSVFGGDFPYIGRYKDMPVQKDMPKIPDEMKEKIMHMFLPVSKETSIMGSDIIGEWESEFKQGNNFSITISTDSKKEADRLFNGLSEGGNVIMPMGNAFWGDYFGMLTDKFGINWMVSFSVSEKMAL